MKGEYGGCMETGDEAEGVHGGIASATAAFVMWGLLPIYWKLLEWVPAYEILCHRMTWSLMVTLLLLWTTGKLRAFWTIVKARSEILPFFLTAVILSCNWFIYIWAVNSGYILEASLGYYITPLVNVCFGVLFLKERIRPLQWVSIGVATLGVLYLTFLYGSFPWIALCLAATFACYGLLRKITTVPPLEGLCLETAILFLPALGMLMYFEVQGSSTFFHTTMQGNMLLAGTGIVTTLPLLCFCHAAQKIPLYLVGLLQYLAPTINVFVGTLLYGEPFPLSRIIGFIFIWGALLIFIGEGALLHIRKERDRRNSTQDAVG